MCSVCGQPRKGHECAGQRTVFEAPARPAAAADGGDKGGEGGEGGEGEGAWLDTGHAYIGAALRRSNPNPNPNPSPNPNPNTNTNTNTNPNPNPNPNLGAALRRFFDERPSDAHVSKWLPAAEGEPALF